LSFMVSPLAGALPLHPAKKLFEKSFLDLQKL